MSYVALKASETVLDGHREVLLAVLLSHFHTQFAEPSCWRSSLRRIPVGTLSVELLVALYCTNPILEQLLSRVARPLSPKWCCYTRLGQLHTLPCESYLLHAFRAYSVLYCTRPRTLLHETPRAGSTRGRVQ